MRVCLLMFIALSVALPIARVCVVPGVPPGIGDAIAKSLTAHQCHIFGRQAHPLLLMACLLCAFTTQLSAVYACHIMQSRCLHAPAS